MAKIQDQNYCKLSETLTAKSILSALKKKHDPHLFQDYGLKNFTILIFQDIGTIYLLLAFFQ